MALPTLHSRSINHDNQATMGNHMSL